MTRIIGFYLLLSVLQLSVDAQTIQERINAIQIKIAEQNTEVAAQKTELAKIKLNLTNKLDVQNSKISDLTNILSGQNTSLAQLSNSISELKIQIENISQDVTTTQSTTRNKKPASLFTRWGRTDCPSEVSQLVYSGVVGGTEMGDQGGAAEYVCLPPSPTFNEKYKTYVDYNSTYMYGAEYLYQPNRNLFGYKVPCAVCRSKYPSVLMVPGRGECYSGWTTAYIGELGAGHYNSFSASQYICLDGEPHTRGTNQANGGRVIFPVKPQCGALSCPNYRTYLMTCVVCLK